MKKKDALIGYSGFVGGNILNQKKFDCLYNTKNIEDIQDKDFSIVVCAAAPGGKRIANENPEKDLDTIERLMSNLKRIKTDIFVLISTINVYPDPNDVDEDTPIDLQELLPYGLHRRNLEELVERSFNSIIIRLPALFGKGLKKNVIYDLLNKNYQYIGHQDSTFQFYNLENIWKDIEKTMENKVKIINFATEPVTVGEVQSKSFSAEVIKNNTQITHENMCTKYGHLWGKDKPYLYTKSEVLRGVRTFVENYENS